MIRPDMIPKECFVAYQQAFKRGGGVGDAIAAALNAWPKVDRYLGAVVLPLPQKEKGGQ